MDSPTFLAHIAPDGRRQSARRHCRNAAEYASAAAAGIGLSKAAYLAALLHDAGKFKGEFADYLAAAVTGSGGAKRGSVNHTFAGVRFVLEKWHGSDEPGYSEITAELIAFAIGAHHGLFDCVNEKRENGFLRRKTKDEIFYEESIGNYLSQCAQPEELECLFRLAVEEMTPLLKKISGIPPQQQDDELADSEICFYTGLLGRMLLSAVIEGDRRDTAEFVNNETFPAWPEDMRSIWSDALDRVERKLSGFPSDQPIQKARLYISDSCRAFAERPGGVYRLNVPTGSGKTLSGLRYALAHAKKWNKSRIIFTVPLLSILDQNAKVLRDYIADDRMILEHHSNLAQPENQSEQLADMELLTETWNAPIIITTLVQLLDTMFSGKTDAVRRFHALCNSVIVIDEVQTVPNKMLTLFNLAVNFLSEICGATVVLSSATQPSLEAVTHPLLQTPPDIVQQQVLWDAFKRTEIQDAGCCRLEELPQLIEAALTDCGSLLVVCNKKDEAAFLLEALSGDGAECFHLSAAMCAAHRRSVLKALDAALAESRAGGKKVVCVSTQVIEAGVDISFQRVIRLAAGMDSVIQSAGRCNRNAESSTPAKVSIIQCTDENLMRLEDIRRGQTATVALLEAFRKSAGRFNGDLAGNEAISFYYSRLYQSMDAGFQDDAVGEYGSVFDLLADNRRYADANCKDVDRYFMHQAFRLSGRLFQVFDQDTTDVLAPYERGREIREELIAASKDRVWDHSRIKKLLEEAKLYSISLYRYQFEQLIRQDALISLFDGSVYALTDGFYDSNTGFALKKGTTDFMGV